MPTHDFADLTDRNAVVTGSSGGIGRAVAMELARGGANVLVHCNRSVDAARQVCEQVRAMGRKSEVITADFGQRDCLTDFCDRAWDVFGGVDFWINNAGADLLTGPDAEAPFSEKLERLLQVDVAATMILSRQIGQRMSDGSGIVNVGWDQADRGMEGDSGELFAASKNAIMGFSRSLAVTLAPRVRVNCVAPGWIKTAWGETAGDYWQRRVLKETPLNRWGTPEDIAAAVRFLCSDQAGFITGQVININGGAVR